MKIPKHFHRIRSAMRVGINKHVQENTKLEDLVNIKKVLVKKSWILNARAYTGSRQVEGRTFKTEIVSP